MKTINPLARLDEDLVLREMKELAHDRLVVPHEDVVTRAPMTTLVTLDAVVRHLFDDARANGENRIHAVVVGDVPVPTLMAVVGVTSRPVGDLAADVLDLALLRVEIVERRRATLPRVLPLLVDRVGEDHARWIGGGERVRDGREDAREAEVEDNADTDQRLDEQATAEFSVQHDTSSERS